MPILISWLYEDRIIWLRNSGQMTLDDMFVADASLRGYLDDSTATRVHLIMDNRAVQGWHIAPDELPKARSANQFMAHPRLGWVVMCGMPQGEKRLANFLGTMAAHEQNARLRTFYTVDEALAFLQEVDDSIPPLQIPE
ncbi:MAG: hypothetical protein ACLFTK_13775 [Anaerolineales bacterium]